MAKFTGPKGKIVRRFGVNIFGNPKYDLLLERRSHAPGQHGPKPVRRRVSDYVLQLIEKQKLRHSYCLLEKQFHRTFRKAQQMSGVTGDNLLTLLETRLDSLTPDQKRPDKTLSDHFSAGLISQLDSTLPAWSAAPCGSSKLSHSVTPAKLVRQRLNNSARKELSRLG